MSAPPRFCPRCGGANRATRLRCWTCDTPLVPAAVAKTVASPTHEAASAGPLKITLIVIVGLVLSAILAPFVIGALLLVTWVGAAALDSHGSGGGGAAGNLLGLTLFGAFVLCFLAVAFWPSSK